MALTLQNVDTRSDDTWGRQRVRIVTVTFDSSYATGGEDLTPANVGLAEIAFVDTSPDSASAAGYIAQYNYSTKKLQLFVEEAVAAGGPLVELANATDVSTVKVRCLIIGR